MNWLVIGIVGICTIIACVAISRRQHKNNEDWLGT